MDIDIEKVIAIRKKAQFAVADMDDGPEKVALLKQIMDKLWDAEFNKIELSHDVSNNDKKTSKIVDDISAKNETDKDKTKKGPGVNGLCRDLGITEDELRTIIDFQGMESHFLTDIPGKGEAEKQRNATILILLLHYYKTDGRGLPSAFLKKRIRSMGIGGITGYGNNIKRNKRYFIPIGKIRSPNMRYALTDPAMRTGHELLKGLLKKIAGV